MKRFGVVLCGVALTAPSVMGSALLDMRIGPNLGPDLVDAVVAPGSGEHFFDLTLLDVGEFFNDGANGYDIMVRAPSGITLLRVEKPATNWMFTNPGALFSVPESEPDHLLISATSPNESVDIIPAGYNTARIYYSVDPGAAPGLYPITLDPGITTLSSSNPPGFQPPPIGVLDPGLVRVTPEPSGLAVLALGGVLAMRRRRRVQALQ